MHYLMVIWNKFLHISKMHKQLFYALLFSALILSGGHMDCVNFMISFQLHQWIAIGLLTLILTILYIRNESKKQNISFSLDYRIYLILSIFSYLIIRGLNELGIAIGLSVITFMFIASSLQKDKIIKFICLFLITNGILAGIWAIYQFISSKPLTGYTDTVTGLIINEVAAIVAVLCQRKIYCHGKRSIKYSLILFYSVIVILSGSRTGIISILTIIAFHPFRNIKIKNRHTNPQIYALFGISIPLIIYMFEKADSTSGRLLIYKSSFMMLDNFNYIIFGRGFEGFKNNYMLYQADVLSNESESTQLLASVIRHPLNELMLILIDYGLIGLIMVLALAFLLFKNLKKDFRVLFSPIIVISTFSYPFTYPSFWILIILMFILGKRNDIPINLNRLKGNILCLTLLGTSIYATVNLSYILHNHLKWKDTFQNFQLGNYESAFDSYHKLEQIMPFTEFYYNYVSCLIYSGELDKAIQISNKMTCNDYDTMMLKGTLFFYTKVYDKAEFYFRNAHNMCPNRFKPLYQLFLLYGEIKNHQKQLELKKIIQSKKIKIPSKEIDNIQNHINNIKI